MGSTIAIAGLGLIGGSLGLALRAAGVRVVATDPAIEAGEALASGACDAFAASLDGALEEGPPDILVLAAPVDRIERALVDLARGSVPLPAGLLVTDTGSVKRAICAAGARLGERGGAAFVGGHPLAGSERSGLGAARADLFRDAPWALVPPGGGGGGAAIERARELVRLAGARPVELDADRHDRVLAATSHLPHLVAAALSRTLEIRAGGDGAFLDLAGKGFLDTTRVAGGPPALWRPIIEANRDHLRVAAADLVRLLEEDVGDVLEAGWAARRKVAEAQEGRR